jgi:hypothetical protein
MEADGRFVFDDGGMWPPEETQNPVFPMPVTQSVTRRHSWVMFHQ